MNSNGRVHKLNHLTKLRGIFRGIFKTLASTQVHPFVKIVNSFTLPY